MAPEREKPIELKDPRSPFASGKKKGCRTIMSL